MHKDWAVQSVQVAEAAAVRQWGEHARLAGSHSYSSMPQSQDQQGRWHWPARIPATQDHPAREFPVASRRLDGQEQIVGAVLVWLAEGGPRTEFRVIAEVR